MSDIDDKYASADLATNLNANTNSESVSATSTVDEPASVEVSADSGMEIARIHAEFNHLLEQRREAVRLDLQQQLEAMQVDLQQQHEAMQLDLRNLSADVEELSGFFYRQDPHNWHLVDDESTSGEDGQGSDPANAVDDDAVAQSEVASQDGSDISRATSPCGSHDSSSSSIDYCVREDLLIASDTVIIQTTDGSLLPAPRVLLTKYVTFFADLPPLIGDTGSVDAATPLELPYATFDGMLLLLGLLRAEYLGEDTDEDPADTEELLDFPNLQSIVDALIIAHIYDIPIIPSIFAQSAYDSVHERPLYAWVIGTLAGGHPHIDFPSLTTDTLQYDTVRLPPEARVILHRYIPDALAVLEADQLRWTRMLDTLKSEVLSTPMSTGINRYTLKCLGRTKRYTKDVLGSPTQLAEPKWVKLRGDTADRALKRHISGGWICYPSIMRLIEDTIACERCAVRLSDRFEHVICEFEKQCPPRCEPYYYCETCYYDAPKDFWDVDGPLVSAWAKKNPGVRRRPLCW